MLTVTVVLLNCTYFFKEVLHCVHSSCDYTHPFLHIGGFVRAKQHQSYNKCSPRFCLHPCNYMSHHSARAVSFQLKQHPLP